MVSLPPFISLNSCPDVTMEISDPTLEVDWAKQADFIVVKGQTPEAMSMTGATLFIYTNSYRDELLASIRLEICARSVIYTRTRFGRQSQHCLSMPCKQARKIKLFSNKPTQVF
jgi:hypothetical protein